MRKFFVFLLIVTAAALIMPISGGTAMASAVSEIAMELNTGAVLEENNADKKLPMASTTKIMTAILVIEDCDLDQVITVPKECVGVEGSSIYLKKDEKISLRDLLYGLMLRSGNDAAAALAITHSGSLDKFCEAMNKKAREIGAENTNFMNPSGLPDPQHYTTARDLCKIACYAMKNETFSKIVSSKSYSGEFRSFENKNKFLKRCDGANGVKTGYTKKAGRCLVSSAKRNNMDVVCVVLNCPDMYERSEEIINGCFEKFSLKNIDKNSVFMSDIVHCKLSESKQILIKNGEKLDFKVVPLNNGKKFKAGDLVAKLEIYSQNNLIFTENLYSID